MTKLALPNFSSTRSYYCRSSVESACPYAPSFLPNNNILIISTEEQSRRLDSLGRKAYFETDGRAKIQVDQRAPRICSSSIHLNISKHFSWGQDALFLSLQQFYYLLLLETLNHSLSMDSVHFLLSLELERSTLVVFFWSVSNIAPGSST